MSVTLDAEKLKKVLIRVKETPNDNSVLTEFLNVAAPIIRVTVEKFPHHLAEDVGQEVRILLIRKAPFLADELAAGKLNNPVNYLFTVAYNAALAYVKKEHKHDQHLVSTDDVKVDPVLEPTSQRKQELLQFLKEEVLAWVRVRFPEKKDYIRAEKFVHAIFEGKRPSFETRKLHKWANQRQDPAKDMYSVVTDKIRELVGEHAQELTE